MSVKVEITEAQRDGLAEMADELRKEQRTVYANRLSALVQAYDAGSAVVAAEVPAEADAAVALDAKPWVPEAVRNHDVRTVEGGREVGVRGDE